MAKLIYVTNVSLDGYIEDQHGTFNIFPPDDDVFASTTDLLRSVGTFLYGRRLYETMAVWEADEALAAQSGVMADFATAWQAASKVVYSTTVAAVSTANTRIERHFSPAAIRELKAAARSDLTIGGANLAAQALKAGLVDECHLYVWPIVVGSGKPGAADRHPRRSGAPGRAPIRKRSRASPLSPSRVVKEYVMSRTLGGRVDRNARFAFYAAATSPSMLAGQGLAGTGMMR